MRKRMIINLNIILIFLLVQFGVNSKTDKSVLDLKLEEAVQLHQTGQVNDAIYMVEKISQHHSGYWEGHYYLGLMYQSQGDVVNAASAYKKLLKLQPQHPHGLNNLGFCYQKLQINHDETGQLFLQALQAEPQHEKAALNLGLWYFGNGQRAEAEQYYLRHIQINPDDHEGYYNYAVLLQHNGKVEDAANNYNKAISKKKDFQEAWLNLATLHHRYGDLEDAVTTYKKTFMHINQSDIFMVAMLYNNMGLAYYQQGLSNEAVDHFQHIIGLLQAKMAAVKDVDNDLWLSLKDTEIHSWSHIYKANKAVCNWVSWDIFNKELVGMVQEYQLGNNRSSALLPFDTLGMDVRADWRLLIAGKHATQWTGLIDAYPLPRPTFNSNQPLRVGYLCFDYNDHPTTHLVEGLFYWHKHSTAIEAFAYSYGKHDNSSYRENMEVLAYQFVDLIRLGNEESNQQIRNDNIHIAVDLQAWTLGGRVELMAYRNAPIQVNYLIYPGTSGAPWMDYIIVDKWVVPPEHALQFTEHLVYLPNSYQVNYYARHLEEMARFSPRLHTYLIDDTFSPDFFQERKRLRAENNLPEKAFVFCNFNKNDKLEPNNFRVWMSILRQVPGSVLWLLKPKENAGGATIRKNLRMFAQSYGVLEERIVFAERVPKAKHLYRHLAADLFVDTFIYGAHSTATDALRGGLPFLTLEGETFPSRVGASLLFSDKNHRRFRLCVTNTQKEFEELAVAFATEKADILRAIRVELMKENALSVLFDTEKYTNKIEESYQAMWEIYLNFDKRFSHLIII